MPVYTTPDQRGDHAARQQCQRKSTEDPENRPSEACGNVLGEGCKAVIERSVADDLRQTQKPDGNCKAGPPLRQAEEDGASHRCAVLQPCSLTVNPCSEQQQLVNKATSRHGDQPGGAHHCRRRAWRDRSSGNSSAGFSQRPERNRISQGRDGWNAVLPFVARRAAENVGGSWFGCEGTPFPFASDLAAQAKAAWRQQ
jgi:hypothetical protein